MRGKNGTRPRGLSIGSESMCLFSDDPLMQGLALFGNGGLLLSHTPPNFTPGSYEVSHMKRARAGSISGRLRSASDLEEKGLIDKSQKGVLKDLIISGDSELQAALDLYEGGDASQLEALMERGLLDRRDSLDLLQDLDLDFGIMDLAVSNEASTGTDPGSNNCVANPLPLLAPEASSADASTARSNINNTKGDGAGGDETFAEEALAGAGGGAKARVSPLRLEDGAASNNFGDGGGGGGRPAGIRGHLQHIFSEDAGDESEHDIDLGVDGEDGTCQFDIGDMVFDTTFEHDYAVHQEHDVDMKVEPVECVSPPCPAKEVGPLRVVATSKLRSHLVPSGGDDDDVHHRSGRPSPGSLGAVMAGAGVHEDHGHGGAGVDGDAPELGSFGTMAAIIGDYSPQFKFSFSDDVHLDLGGGLKDELRDLESFADPLPDPGGKGDDILGIGSSSMAGVFLSGSRTQHFLSRGGSSAKSDAPSTPASRSGSGRSDTFTPEGARLKSPEGCPREDYDDEEDYNDVYDEEEEEEEDEVAVAAQAGGGFTSNHYSSRAAYSVRRTGSYTTSTRSAAARARGGMGSGAGRLVAGAGAGARRSHVGDSRNVGGRENQRGAYGGEIAVTTGHRSGGAASTPHHATRGRPVVSGMEVMVGDGPRAGVPIVGNGVDGERRKFIGAYSPEARRQRVQRFLQKRENRVWTKMVKYDVRKNFADTRMRVKGRFVKKEDEALLREVMACA